MDELLRVLGLSNTEELTQFVIENPEHPISKQIMELFEMLKEHKGNNKKQP